MSDPLRTDGSRAFAAASEADRDAKIEQLLLAGLDHYFAARVRSRHQRLDARAVSRSQPRPGPRVHRAGAQRPGRAPARVRGAAAERSRRLRAGRRRRSPAPGAGRDRGGRADRRSAGGSRSAGPSRNLTGRRTALAVTACANAGRRPPRPSRPRVGRRSPSPSCSCWSLAASGAYSAAVWGPLDWRSMLPWQTPPARVVGSTTAREAGLALPRSGELALTRARALVATGHLRDALATLDLVRPTDPQKAEADRLRGEIQLQLIALTSVPAQPRRGESGPTRPMKCPKCGYLGFERRRPVPQLWLRLLVHFAADPLELPLKNDDPQPAPRRSDGSWTRPCRPNLSVLPAP